MTSNANRPLFENEIEWIEINNHSMFRRCFEWVPLSLPSPSPSYLATTDSTILECHLLTSSLLDSLSYRLSFFPYHSCHPLWKVLEWLPISPFLLRLCNLNRWLQLASLLLSIPSPLWLLLTFWKSWVGWIELGDDEGSLKGEELRCRDNKGELLVAAAPAGKVSRDLAFKYSRAIFCVWRELFCGIR